MLKNIVRAWILISSHLRTSVTFTNLCLPLSYELQIFLKILTSSSEYWYPRSIAKLINLRLTNQWLHIATDTYNTRPVRKLVYNGCIFVSLFLSLIRTVYTETVCSPTVSSRVPLKCWHVSVAGRAFLSSVVRCLCPVPSSHRVETCDHLWICRKW